MFLWLEAIAAAAATWSYKNAAWVANKHIMWRYHAGFLTTVIAYILFFLNRLNVYYSRSNVTSLYSSWFSFIVFLSLWCNIDSLLWEERSHAQQAPPHCCILKMLSDLSAHQWSLNGTLTFPYLNLPPLREALLPESLTGTCI